MMLHPAWNRLTMVFGVFCLGIGAWDASRDGLLGPIVVVLGVVLVAWNHKIASFNEASIKKHGGYAVVKAKVAAVDAEIDKLKREQRR